MYARLMPFDRDLAMHHTEDREDGQVGVDSELLKVSMGTLSSSGSGFIHSMVYGIPFNLHNVRHGERGRLDVER
jgi:hypothetical protein